MSGREKEMAELLAKAHRNQRLSAIIAHVTPNVSAILDLGCGIGVLTTRLAKRFPSKLVVGIDRSKYLLSRLQRKKNVSVILGDVPTCRLETDLLVLWLPFKSSTRYFISREPKPLTGHFRMFTIY